MKSEKNILIAFILNFGFSIFEFIGGIFTGSVAIMSDAVHDFGDAASIGIAFFLEKISHKQPDRKFTFGYSRYSVIGSVITTLILLVGSVFVTINAVGKIIEPTEINYDGMLIFAVVGLIVNLAAAFFTKDGDSLNQKAVNLHMLEDVLGWAVVLVGAIIMRFTDIKIIDPIMSIAVAVFIFVNALKGLKNALDLFLEKMPDGLDIDELKEHILEIEGVIDLHHIHIWSMDSVNHFATMHVVVGAHGGEIKQKVKNELKEHGIAHATLELETEDEHCSDIDCHIETDHNHHGHHHGHNHGHHH